MKYKDLVKPNDKITLQEFWGSDKKLAIHCDTKDKAKKLLQAFDSYGIRWVSGQRYTETNEFHVYRNNTCYGNNGCYCDIDYYVANNYTIYEFEDVILPTEKKWIFTEDEKVILRNLPAEYKWITRDKNGYLFVYINSPIKNEKSNYWILFGIDNARLYLFEHLFQTIKWEDDTACEFRKYI